MCGYSTSKNIPRTIIERNSFENIAKTVFPLSGQVNFSCVYEPFTFEGILDYLETAVKYNIPKLTLTTNGLLLNRAQIEEIVTLGFPQMNISIDGATKRTYESIRIGGQFNKLIENLQNLAAIKQERNQETPRIQFNFVLMEENIEEVSLFIRIMSQFRPYKLVFVHRNNKLPSAGQRLKIEFTLKQALAECVSHKVLFEEVPNLCLSFEEILQAYGCDMEGMPQVVHQCSDPWHFMRFAPNGDVFMCPSIGEPAGNILHSPIVDIWNGEVYNKLRKQLDQGIPPSSCQSCHFSNMGLVQFRQLQDAIEHTIVQHMKLKG
jgi:radical SAM protein with 4Fe4S-binding SPASM domain